MKAITIYFSRADENYFGGSMRYISKGNTEVIAEYIQQLCGADLFKVERKNPYSAGYMACIKEAQDEQRKVTEPLDIKIMSWYPLGGKGMTAELLNNPLVASLANKHHKSAAQIILKWHVQMGFIVIPGSKNVDHIKDNIDIFDFRLSDEDMAEIAKLNNGERRYVRTEEALRNFESWKVPYENK